MDPLSRVTPATVDVLDVLIGRAAPTWGLLVVKQAGRPTGSVYPILERLEAAGWVTSEWEDDPERVGPRRRMYELTPEGATAAQATVDVARARWQAKAARIGAGARAAGSGAAGSGAAGSGARAAGARSASATGAQASGALA